MSSAKKASVHLLNDNTPLNMYNKVESNSTTH